MCVPTGALRSQIIRLPVAAAVLAAEDIDLDAEPEKGRAGEVAAALDALSDAEKKAKAAEEDAAAASEKADQQLREMRDAALSGIDREALMKMAAAAREAREQERFFPKNPWKGRRERFCESIKTRISVIQMP